jgi:hypothetical protein
VVLGAGEAGHQPLAGSLIVQGFAASKHNGLGEHEGVGEAGHQSFCSAILQAGVASKQAGLGVQLLFSVVISLDGEGMGFTDVPIVSTSLVCAEIVWVPAKKILTARENTPNKI